MTAYRKVLRQALQMNLQAAAKKNPHPLLSQKTWSFKMYTIEIANYGPFKSTHRHQFETLREARLWARVYRMQEDIPFKDMSLFSPKGDQLKFRWDF